MRDNTVSIAKAFAIILMVLAHTWFSDTCNKWINMFHMPLFFFFAGYCFKDKYLTDFKTFAIKRVTGLYKPYVKWSLIFLVLHNVFFYFNIYNNEYGFRGKVSELYSNMDFVKRAVRIITSMDSHDQILGGYWFLKSLFFSSFIGYATIRFLKNAWLRGGILLMLTIIVSFCNIHFPYFAIGGRDLFAALFFILGYSYKNMNCKVHDKWLMIPLGLFIVTIGEMYWQCTLLKFNYKQIIPFLFSAMAGILMIFKVSAFINIRGSWLKNLLVYIGDNTLTILTWHLLSYKIVSLLIIKNYGLLIERLAEFPTIAEYSAQGWFVPYFFIGLVVPLAFTRIKILK